MTTEIDTTFLDALASGNPTPGGGGAAEELRAVRLPPGGAVKLAKGTSIGGATLVGAAALSGFQSQTRPSVVVTLGASASVFGQPPARDIRAARQQIAVAA